MTAGTDSSKGDLYKKGQLLIRQGEEPRFMYYMHSGALEILSAPPEYEELHTDILLSKSKRVGTIKEKNLISGLSILFAEPYKKSIRAIEDSYVSKYPIKEGGFQQIVTDNTPLAVDILSNLFRRLELSIPDASRYANLYQNIARINDNICLRSRMVSMGRPGKEYFFLSMPLLSAMTNFASKLPGKLPPFRT